MRGVVGLLLLPPAAAAAHPTLASLGDAGGCLGDICGWWAPHGCIMCRGDICGWRYCPEMTGG